MSDASPDARYETPHSKDIGQIRHLWNYMIRYPGLIFGASVALLLASGATLSIPLIFKPIIDGGVAGDVGGETVDFYFRLFLGIVAILALATAVRFYFVTIIGERIVADIRRDCYARLIAMSPEYYETHRSGDVVSRLVADTTVVLNFVGSYLSIALRNLLQLIGGAILLATLSLKLFGILFIMVPVIVMPLVFVAKKLRHLSKDSQDRIADVGARVDEALGAIQVVQSFTHEDAEKARFNETVEDAYQIARRRIRVRSFLTALMIGLVMGGIVMVLWKGVTDTQAGSMTKGDMTAFVMLAIMVAGAVAALSECYGELQRAAGAASSLSEFLALVPKIIAPENPVALPQPSTGTVAFDGVTFHYPSRPDDAALEAFSLTVKPGETVALVGPSGAGKSTVLQLLLRFYDPQKGEVVVDGVRIADAEPQDVRRRMAVVPQDTIIFGDSARENIRYGKPDATDEEVEAAAAAAAVHDVIMSLPQGYDTYLGEKGARLSGGQRQRIAIARAILRDAPILLLDEATSALDSASELLVQEALQHLMQGRTTLVIAHRLATVRQADRIVVMEEGRIVAEGTHDQLTASGGLYAKLAAMQFGAEQAA